MSYEKIGEGFVVGIISIFILGLVLAIGLLIAFPVKWCWNYAVAPTFALPAITWGKAWCLIFLSQVLIKTRLHTDGKK